MKKVFISMLALAALASCSSEEVLNEPVDNGQRVPINLRAGVVQVETKGAINDIPADGLENVVFMKSEHASAADWSTATKHTASIAAGGEVTFADGTLYYPINKDKKTFLTGYYPESIGTPSNGTITIGADQFTGQEDIMFATQLSGSKETPITGKAQFEHRLSQLKFTLVKDDSYDASNKVKTIRVMGTHKPKSFNLATGTLTYANETSPLEITDGTGITVDGNTYSQTVLVEAIDNADSKTVSITLEVELSDGTIISDIAVNGINKPGVGQSHNVTLTFKQKDISATATISPWTDSDVAGTGTVE